MALPFCHYHQCLGYACWQSTTCNAEPYPPCPAPPPPLSLRSGEYKAEVGLLSRRITFSSDTTSRTTNIGEHRSEGSLHHPFRCSVPCCSATAVYIH